MQSSKVMCKAHGEFCWDYGIASRHLGRYSHVGGRRARLGRVVDLV